MADCTMIIDDNEVPTSDLLVKFDLDSEDPESSIVLINSANLNAVGGVCINGLPVNGVTAISDVLGRSFSEKDCEDFELAESVFWGSDESNLELLAISVRFDEAEEPGRVRLNLQASCCNHERSGIEVSLSGLAYIEPDIRAYLEAKAIHLRELWKAAVGTVVTTRGVLDFRAASVLRTKGGSLKLEYDEKSQFVEVSKPSLVAEVQLRKDEESVLKSRQTWHLLSAASVPVDQM